MKTIAKLCLFLSAIAFFTSCQRMVTGTINCKDIATYTSPYGLLNSIQATVGDVYYINQKDKFVGYMFHEKPDSNYVLVDSTINSMLIAADIQVSTSFDAETPKIKLISTKIEEMVERNTQMKLKNATRIRLNRPYNFLQKIETNHLKTIEKLDSDKIMFMAISSVVMADELVLEVKNADSTKAGIQTFKIDGITFQMRNNCDDLIDVDAKKAGVFFKALFFSYNKNSQKLTPSTQLFDFKGYNVNTVNQ